MTQEEKWDKAKDGDKEEIRHIVEKYYKVAYKIAHWWAKTGRIEESEAVGLANIAIMKCVRKGYYDETRGIKFTSYLGSAVHNEIRMFLRKERKERGRVSFSLDEPLATVESNNGEQITTYGEVLQDECTLEQMLEDKFEFEDAYVALHEVSEYLTDAELTCLILYLIGTPMKEISRNLGYSQSYSRKILSSAQNKLREHAESKEQEDSDGHS